MGLLDKHLGYRAPLDAIRAVGADPSNVRFDAILSPTEGVLGGKPVILLGTNNYLGLTRHPDVMQAARDALERYGTSCTGSRLLNDTIPQHSAFEEEIADFLGYPKAMLFTTGFMANQGALSSLCRRGDQVFSARDNHASIVDGLTTLGRAIEDVDDAWNQPLALDSRLRRPQQVHADDE